MTELSESQFQDKIRGTLLGTALGDSLGFIAEGMTRQSISERFGKITKFYVVGNHGFVTDDTEHSALVAQCLARNPSDVNACVSEFRRSLVLWLASFPFGVGRTTAQACLRMAIGMKKSGVSSASNGAAMRAAVVGTFFYDQLESRLRFGTELARSTHSGSRALEGALFVAELASACCLRLPEKTLVSCFSESTRVVRNPGLLNALEKAANMATMGIELGRAAEELNGQPGGFVLHSLPFSIYCFLRYGDGDVLECLAETIAGGGDTDTNAAIVGALLGALKGEVALPENLLARIDDGPFGPKHLRQLADALTDAKFGRNPHVPGYALAHSALRNVLLIPVILGHAAIRLVPIRAST